MGKKKIDPKAPALVLLTLLLIAAAVGLRLWANDQRLQVPNLRAMATAPGGQVFVVLGNTLYIESTEGKSLRVLPLEEWDVDDFHGDLAVLKDGSVILAEGRLGDIGLEEGLRMYARGAPSTGDPMEGLMRCRPGTGQCDPLTGNGDRAEFRRAFSIDVDETTGVIYVSEPGRHRLLQVTPAGERLAVSDEGWRFPNGLRVVAPGRVGFVDTNHQRYVELLAGPDGFGDVALEESILDWPDVDGNHRFPFAALRDANGALWMLVADMSMANARLYRQPQDGQAAHIALPEGADPVSLAATPDGVLVADARTFRVYRFGLNGEMHDDFGSPALTGHLSTSRAQHARYRQLFDYSLFAVLLVAVPALGVGLYLQNRSRPGDAAEKQIDVRATDEPLPEFRNVEAQFSRLHGEFIFWRKFTVLATKESFRFGVLAAVFFVALTALLLQAIQWAAERNGQSFTTAFMDSNAPLIFGLAVIGLLCAWLSAAFERIVITRDGIRYVSWMPRPLDVLLPFYRSWYLRWDEIRSLKLVHAGSGGHQLAWRYEIIAKNGRVKRIHPLSWRLAGEAETGIPLRGVLRRNPRMFREVIQRTLLFRLLGRQWQPKAAETMAETA